MVWFKGCTLSGVGMRGEGEIGWMGWDSERESGVADCAVRNPKKLIRIPGFFGGRHERVSVSCWPQRVNGWIGWMGRSLVE